jgi:hypothetical protein
MKILIFDSGPLINLSMNGLLPVLEKLKKNFQGKFMITKQVRYEVVDRPIGIQRFELGALRIQDLIERGVLELPGSLGISEDEITEKTKLYTDKANHSLKAGDSWINIVSEAEMSCLALSAILSDKKINNIIAIDERTTRVLSENPKNLEKLMSEKMHYRVRIDNIENMNSFAKFRFIRSPEIVYVAFKKGLLEISGKKALEAVLYATKFKGAAISFEELEQLKKL